VIEVRPEPFGGPAPQQLVRAMLDELEERYGPGGGASAPPPDAAEFEPPHGIFLVAYDGATPVGCGGLRVVRPGLGELNRMFAARAARRRGAGRALVAALEEAAHGLGCSRLRLETGTGNPEAIELYRACGYRPIRRFGPFRQTAHSRCFSRHI
jgi:GNAT superfamily N-acetyltransferase